MNKFVPDNNTLDKHAGPGEDLHSRPFTAAIANDDFPRLADDGYFARIPQMTLFNTRRSEIIFKQSVLVENLFHLKHIYKKKKKKKKKLFIKKN